MDSAFDITPFHERRYQEIPIDKVKVVNSRNRDQEQFDMNVESIDHVGLLKPIRVNDKFVERTGEYELICGEGRLLAHKKLGRELIKAEVVTCTRKEAHLQSLIENIARTKPGSMDFARELKRLYDEGWDFKQIARIACKSEHYIRDYIRLVEQGEERLIHGVEQGVFPINFAIQVATTDDGQLQNILMDAFDEGLVTTKNFAQARQIITARARSSRNKSLPAKYTVTQLRQDIAEATRTKTSYVREAKAKENRFMTLLNGINNLWQDEDFVQILREAKLFERPELAGEFHYET
ncbi:MAG: ParB N-terminal domain-containing protein [Planctomycetales bacterium]|nr:ParB N-terminal domain-containing protein [Planctomycetales bacterium]